MSTPKKLTQVCITTGEIDPTTYKEEVIEALFILTKIPFADPELDLTKEEVSAVHRIIDFMQEFRKALPVNNR